MKTIGGNGKEGEGDRSMSVDAVVRGENTDRKHSLWPRLRGCWNRLGDIRVAKWTSNLLVTCKGLPVIGCVVQTLETGVNTIVKPVVTTITKPIVEQLPVQVASVADCAVTVIEKLDQVCLYVVQKPSQLLSRAERCISCCLRCIVQGFIHSGPGQAVLLLLDLLVSLIDCLLDMISPELVNEEVLMGGDTGPGKRAPGTVSTSHKQQRKAGKGRTDTGGEVVQTPFYSRLLSGLLLAPLRAVVFLLSFTRHFFLRFSTKPASPAPSLKKTSLLNRRKLSPKKRLAGRSSWRRFLMHALRFLGVRQMTKLPPRYPRLKGSQAGVSDHKPQEALGLAVIPEREKAADKRRHSDVSSESLSDSDVHELMQDLEEYVSDEDPDFRPDEQPSEDSLEFAEGDTESFIELEDEDIEPPKNPKRVSILTKDVKLEADRATPVVQIADDVVKFDKKDLKKSPEKAKPTSQKDGNPPMQKEPEKTKPVLQKSDNVKSDKKSEEPKPVSKSKRSSEGNPTSADTKIGHDKKLKIDIKTNGHRTEPVVNGKADKENQAPLKSLSPKKGLHPQNTSSPKLQVFGRKVTK